MRRGCIVALTLMASAGPAFAQPAAQIYAAAIARYQRGDLDGAARAVAGWRAADFKDSIAKLPASPSAWIVLESAAMFHTDLVVLEREVEDARIALHIGVADAIVGRLTPLRTTSDARVRDQVAAFQERWYELGASVFLAMTAPNQADELIGQGLRQFKRSARLLMYQGIVEELRAHIADPNLQDPRVIAMAMSTQARRRIVMAEHRYRDALEIDPSLTEARIRLGRTLALRNERTARQELEKAMAEPAAPREKHLAHLFLGAISEFEHDLPAARDHYAAAVQIYPGAQSALVALSYTYSMTGREADARGVMSSVGADDNDDTPDPFADYLNGGLSRESYRWLREQVQP
jgi:tetratricopeptide (TPR) repeat protein